MADPPSAPATPSGPRSAARSGGGALDLSACDLTPIHKRAAEAHSSPHPLIVGVIGPRCAGKTTLSEYLATKLGFQRWDAAALDHGRLMEEIMCDWKRSHVLDGLTAHDARLWLRRPLFYVLFVDAPVLERFRRAAARRSPHDPLSLEEFIKRDDVDCYGARDGSRSGCREAMPYARVRLVNDGSVEHFLKLVADSDLANPEYVRPSWDSYFMRLAELASQRSNCMKRRVGAIVVRENRVVSSGYNGTPRGCQNCNEGGCRRCNGNARAGTGLDECLCLHAEENALLEAGRERAAGAVLYTSLLPCLGCTKKIVQAGVREVVFSAAYAESMDAVSRALLAEAGVRIRQHALGRPASLGPVSALDDSFCELALA
eukprot:tig00001590_g9377.t1